MKKLRFMIVAAILAVAMIGTASADGFTTQKKVIKVTLERAVTVPGLARAIYLQVDRDMLKNEQEIYAPKVYYRGNIYQVTGTHDQWKRFFRHVWKVRAEPKRIELGTS